MKIKYLSPILASIAIALTVNPAFTTSTNSPNETIYCQSNSEVPTTIAKRANGEDLTIFHWRNEVLPEYLNPLQLCEEVSAQLQDYANKGYQLSSFQTHDMKGLPIICAEEIPGECSRVLFTLYATNNQQESNLLLGQILDEGVKGEQIISIERGVQFYGYKVSFWSLLGF